MNARTHLNGLNGLRAIAAVTVVLSHTGPGGSEPDYLLPKGVAEYAVTIFFTLSGFLITYLLCIEKKNAPINIRNFYMRRILRIWPLYFAYLIIAILIIYGDNLSSIGSRLPWYLFFLANVPPILHTSISYISHYWSLGTEEQFYIFWPWLIRNTKNTLKVLFLFTVSFFVLKLFARFIFYQWDNITPLHVLNVFRFECMSMGGIAAIYCHQRNKKFVEIVTHPVTAIFCWLCLVAMLSGKFSVTPLVNQDLAALITVGLIMNQSFSKRPVLSMENPFFDLLGKISYGMYIIHPLVIFFFRPFVVGLKTDITTRAFVMYGGTLSLTVALAWLSYSLFERRFLKLKDRFSQVKSQESKYLV